MEAEVRSSGREGGDSPLKTQVAMQGALLWISSAMVVSKVFVGITSSKSVLKKYVYVLGRHISPEWLLGTLRKKTGVLQVLL